MWSTSVLVRKRAGWFEVGSCVSVETAGSLTLEEAVAAVEATLGDGLLRVDRRRARQDTHSFLLVVLDTGRGAREAGPVENGPRLVDRRTCEVTRLTVPEALRRAELMEPATG
jgi:hypothetical protein